MTADFNSHAHVERDEQKWGHIEKALNFNSHAHVERDHRLERRKGYLQNFNSHAHVERDDRVLIVDYTRFISTHTLTWSVTGG